MQSQYTVINFPMICLKWLDNKRNEVTANTYAVYEKILTRYAVPFFGNGKFELNADILRKYIKEMQDNGIAEKVICQHIFLLRAIFSHENKMWVTPFIEIDDELTRPRKKAERLSFALGTSDSKKLENYLTEHLTLMNFAVLLSNRLGLTSGMMCALRWTDIDIEKRKLTVSRVVMREPNVDRKSLSEPKTILNERDYHFNGKLKTVTIPKKTAELMTDFIPDDHTKFVLTNTHNITDPRSYQYYVKRCYKECGIEK